MSATAPLLERKQTSPVDRRTDAIDPGCVKTSPAHSHGEWFFLYREIRNATKNLPSSNSNSTEVHSTQLSRHHVFTQPRPEADLSRCGTEALLDRGRTSVCLATKVCVNPITD